MAVSDRIKKLREESNLSQAKLAKFLGVTRSSVNAWEMGISMPTIQYVVSMAQFWHVSTDYLLDIEDHETLSLSGFGEDEKKLIYSLIEYFKKHT